MQELPNDTSHDLLVKYLLDEASPEEVISIEQWLNKTPDNRQYFEQLRTIWNESKQLAPEQTIDEEIAWQRFRQKQQHRETVAPVVRMGTGGMNWMKIAAIFVLIAGAGYLTWFMSGKMNSRQLAAGNEVATYTLPDGSVVVLNKNASLSYPSGFKGDKRQVKLEGEAFFTVVADARKPFIIDVDDVSVKVVGTSFNVKNTSIQTEVVVETGVVDVTSNRNSVQLKQNERAIVLKNGKAPEKQVSNSMLYRYYRTNQFVCVETPLPELVETLNEAYHANISIGSASAARLKLTTTLDNKSLEETLKVIRETLGIRIERAGTEIIIK